MGLYLMQVSDTKMKRMAEVVDKNKNVKKRLEKLWSVP